MKKVAARSASGSFLHPVCPFMKKIAGCVGFKAPGLGLAGEGGKPAGATRLFFGRIIRRPEFF
jgi:hypothetical protein